ncbi:unannotated protein [freshwater metagenome]|uniref:Unannotated protein n=1 Tax=freshwater metagenome TaxID=449393 RepID=A0A6J6MQI0_9ZZZZ|nr:hypothetical protein [Actinomycetota bacterium]
MRPKSHSYWPRAHFAGATTLTIGLMSIGLLASAVMALGFAAPAQAATPAIGECYNYPITVRDEVSSAAGAVSCTSAHTAETYWTGSLKPTFGPPSKATPGARLAATTACNTQTLNAYVAMPGRTLPSRWLSFAIFPTDAQWSAGERWVRCDAVFKTGLKLTNLTSKAADFVVATGIDYSNFCTPSQPNGRNTESYPCADPKKNWIMVAARDLGGPGTKFPGTSNVEKRTRAICSKIAKRYNGASKFPSWWAIWPTDRGWKEGRREAQCLVPLAQYNKEVAPVLPAG